MRKVVKIALRKMIWVRTDTVQCNTLSECYNYFYGEEFFEVLSACIDFGMVSSEFIELCNEVVQEYNSINKINKKIDV